MIAVLCEISPLNRSTGQRVAVRVSNINDPVHGPRINAAGGQTWAPAITDTGRLAADYFNGDFRAGVTVPSTSVTINMGVAEQIYPGIADMVWSGAPVTLYAERTSIALPWSPRFVGRVESFNVRGRKLALTIKVDDEPFTGDVLANSYAGTGLIEGDPDLKNQVKPLVIGAAQNVRPRLINAVDSVYQFSGYGPIEAVDVLYERGSAFEASFGNFATYAALVAADIPRGRWATCLAHGLIRLGAPEAGVITADLRGHAVGGVTPRKTGAIITALAGLAGVPSGLLDSAALAAMDSAVPYDIDLVLTEKIDLLAIAQRLALPCGYQVNLSATGVMSVSRPKFSAPVLTINANGTTDPQVINANEESTSAPYWRITMGAARSWHVHSDQEIAFTAPLVPRGLYSATETYREGMYVELADGSQWLYINPVPSAGNAPPTWPTTSNSYWSNTAPPVQADYSLITNLPAAINPDNILPGGRIDAEYAQYGPGGPLIIDLQPAEANANITETRTAQAIANQGPAATDPRGLNPLFNPAANLVYDAAFRLGGAQWTLGSAWSVFVGDYGEGAYAATSVGGTNVAASPSFPAQPGTGLYLSLDLWAGGMTGGSLNADIQWLDSSGASIGFSARVTATNGAGWQRYQSALLVAPAGTASGRVRVFTEGASNTSAAFKLVKVSSAAHAPFSDEATFGARYWGGPAIEDLRPAEANANVTETRTAQAIAGQGPLATAPSAVPYLNSGITIASNGTLNGGGGGQVTIGGLGYAGDLNATWGAVLGSNLRNSAATIVLADADVITGQGTAAAITGQGALATKSAVNLASTEVLNKSLANLDSTANTKLDGIETGATVGGVFDTNLRETTGGTFATLANFKTSLGTAAAITGQAAWATSTIPTARLNNLDNSGNLASLANITTRNLSQLNGRAWTNLFRADGTTAITDAAAITSLGTAAAIAGQGALATKGSVAWNAEITGRPAFVTDTTTADGQERLNPWYVRNPADGSYLGARWAAEGGANVTETRTAQAIANQGALAVLNQVPASRSEVGSFDNIIPDNDYRDPAWWGFQGLPNVYFAPMDSAWEQRRSIVFQCDRDFDFSTPYFTVEPGSTYRVRVRVWNNDTGAGWTGAFWPLIHMPLVAWWSLKHGSAVSPDVADASNAIVANGDTGAQEFYFLASSNTMREIQFRFKSTARGSSVILQVQITKVPQLGKDLIKPGTATKYLTAEVETALGTAQAIVNQGAGATANNLAQLDATAAAQLTTALNGGLIVAGWGESLKRRIANGASINLAAQVSVAAGGSTSGNIKARIEVSPFGANSWTTVETGAGVSVTPSEPGIDTVSGTYTNSTGAEQLFEFRATIVRTPGTAGGTVIAAQSYVEG